MTDSLPIIQQRLDNLREQMQSRRIDAYLVTNADPHNSEYSADHWLARKWVCGFTGSAGDLLVTHSGGGLWTDGRYFIQAIKQLEGTGIQLFRKRIAGTPTIAEHLADQLAANSRVGVDGRTINQIQFEELKAAFAAKNIELIITEDLVANIWQQRPARPTNPVFIHDMQYAGKSTGQKLADIRSLMLRDKVDQVLITAIDDVMWLMNIRGRDNAFFPGSEAYALLSQNTAKLFMDSKKLPAAVCKVLLQQGVSCWDYHELPDTLALLDTHKNLKYSAYSSNSLLVSRIHPGVTCIAGDTYAQRGKIVKNAIESEQLQLALKYDGTAIVQFMRWLDENVHSGEVTELSAERQLRSYRKALPNYICDSFSTIAGYAEHGAIMHYSATSNSNKIIGTDNYFLLDSGGQYLGGTTDITRTFSFCELSEQQKIDYTLVLKGVIRLTQTKFLKGTAGNNLDIMAPGALWQQCVDYKCGTGHGVGICLNVHEGPQNLSQSVKDNEPLVPGMTITVEPGVYREGEYGIRIENILQVVPVAENQFGVFYGFKTLTLAPIATNQIISDLLSKEEQLWLNDYHLRVAEELTPLLQPIDQQWLAGATQPI
ncbi:MAG: xaa-Pro aminopeptidase [Osedax symbiont Rs2]|nr:MAG: xaa-Pro aminopeptidase [Osedax symbiont Rs2]